MALTEKTNRGDMRLLLAEVMQHIARVRDYLAGPDRRAMADLQHKAAYISTLAVVTRNQNFNLENARPDNEKLKRLHHGLASVSALLHRIAELALNVARQCDYLSEPEFLKTYDLDIFFEEILSGLNLIPTALEQRKLKLALRLCRVEESLDTQYAIRFARLIQELEEGCGQPADRVTLLMIIHYFERMGDLMLEIGEELIYIFLGQHLKFSQYQALGAGLRASGLADRPIEGQAFHSIWSGRSGCRINVLNGNAADLGRGEPVLFKHGPAAKMEEERRGLETWAALWPGLPPAILAFVPAGPESEAGLLLEYIHGETLYDMMVADDSARAIKELTGALNLMAAIWKESRVDEECRADFVGQAERRLGPLSILYPDLIYFSGSFCGVATDSLNSLMRRAAEVEARLPAPFSVRIHGDFNLSNIMRDEAGSYRLIDLHRSRLSDYAQDISVLTMSILRLPLFEAERREKLSRAARLVWTFAKDFGAANGDPGIEARLAFGLARSYLTSARFEGRRARAATYIAYSRHIWEALISFGRKKIPWKHFRLDTRLLYI